MMARNASDKTPWAKVALIGLGGIVLLSRLSKPVEASNSHNLIVQERVKAFYPWMHLRGEIVAHGWDTTGGQRMAQSVAVYWYETEIAKDCAMVLTITDLLDRGYGLEFMRCDGGDSALELTVHIDGVEYPRWWDDADKGYKGWRLS